MVAMRPTTLDIDLDALRANLDTAKGLAGGRPLLCVVKANAYGHGLVPVSRALADAGAAQLGVATVAEGERLRAAGITLPVLVMGGFLAGEAGAIAAAGLSPSVFQEQLIAPLAEAARARGITLEVHVKVGTGMGRIGFAADQAAEAIRKVMGTRGLSVAGVFTHFAEADLADSPAAAEQLERLAAVYRALGDDAGAIPFWHAANSAALIRQLEHGEWAPASLFRPGIMLYGQPPSDGFQSPVPLHPVATWKARVIQVKEVPEGTPISYGRTFITRRRSRIATLPVGYADGYRRELSNKGQVLIRGRRCPVVGRVCMDMIMVDVTDLGEAVEVGEEAVLFGRQGQAELSATEVATACGTISYDILCGISERVPRHYPGGSGPFEHSRKNT